MGRFLWRWVTSRQTTWVQEQAVEVGVPPTTIIPSDLEEFVLPSPESVSLKVVVPERLALPSKDTVSPTKLKATSAIWPLGALCASRSAAKEGSYTLEGCSLIIKRR